MPVDTQRLAQLRDRQRQAMSVDDDTILSDAEITELVGLERQHAFEQSEIRATARREVEQRKAEAERQERRNATALPYRRPSSLPGRGLDAIRKGLGHG